MTRRCSGLAEGAAPIGFGILQTPQGFRASVAGRRQPLNADLLDSARRELLVVHGISLSPYVRKVRAVLAEKHLPYASKPVVAPGPEDFGRISPLRRIPVLEHEGFTVADSSVIVAYLERVFPADPVYPSDPREYATALFIEEYSDTMLGEVLAPIFRERIRHKKFDKRDCDDAAIAHALERDIPPVLDYLEGLAPSEGFIVGDVLSIADVAVASRFVNFQHGGEEVDAGRWPMMASYLGRIHSRPSFRSLIEEEREFLARF